MGGAQEAWQRAPKNHCLKCSSCPPSGFLSDSDLAAGNTTESKLPLATKFLRKYHPKTRSLMPTPPLPIDHMHLREKKFPVV